MGNRYHYDKNGKLKGFSSSHGPWDWLAWAIPAVFLLLILRGCGS